MPIISSTIFPWAELHNDFQEPVHESGIVYPSITHYICAMTQLTGIATRYIINEPITSKAIDVAHSYYTKEMYQTEANSIFKFYCHAIQQNQLFSDTLEAIVHTNIAYNCTSPEYPYVTPSNYIEYDSGDGYGHNTIGTLLERVGGHYLYTPDSDRTEMAYVGDDNILSPLYVYSTPIVIDGNRYYSALEFSFTNMFALIKSPIQVPLVPIDMLIEFKLAEQERLDQIVRRMLPRVIRQRFQTINPRRLLLTAYTLGDVDYEITFTENYLPNQMIATITSGVHTHITNKIVDENSRCQDDINCVYSGRLIRPYTIIKYNFGAEGLSQFTFTWVLNKMKRVVEVFNGVSRPLLKDVTDGPLLLNAFIDTMYTSCSFIRFSDSVVDTVPVEVLREMRSYLSRKSGYADLEHTIAHEHNLFLYLLWSYGAYLITWLQYDYPDESHSVVLDQIKRNIPIFNQKEREQAMAQCIKQLLDFYKRIDYYATKDQVRQNVFVVFGVEDEEDYYETDIDTALQSRIQFYMPLRNRSSDELQSLLDLVGVPDEIPKGKRPTPSPNQLNQLLEMVDPGELNKSARRLRRRARR